MAGHSQFKNIMHRKGRQDAVRARLFTRLQREIQVASRAGLPDPGSNPRLRAAIQAAKAANMPKDNIERAVQRGAGGGEGADAYDAITYEGYGPEGVAIIVEALTDNRNRTAADVRSIFSKHNASLGKPGSVAWQFERKGVVLIAGDDVDEDEIVLQAADAGAEDAELDGDVWQVTTDAADLASVRDALESSGLTITSAELTLVPKNTVALEEDAARKLLRLIDALEENDDVQDVYANFDIPDAVLEAVAG